MFPGECDPLPSNRAQALAVSPAIFLDEIEEHRRIAAFAAHLPDGAEHPSRTLLASLQSPRPDELDRLDGQELAPFLVAQFLGCIGSDKRDQTSGSDGANKFTLRQPRQMLAIAHVLLKVPSEHST